MKRSVLMTCLLAIAIITLSGCSVFGIATTEEASYTLVRKSDSFEIREYPELVLVETRAAGDWSESQRTAFNRLFRYISGANSAQQKVAMTAPVLLDTSDESQSSEKIAMTAPVIRSGRGEGMTMSFVLPSAYSLETAPKPTNSEVRLVSREERTLLVYRFSGFLGQESIDEAEKALLTYAREKGLELDRETLGSAGYNPPWTLPWFRRNEVFVEISDKPVN